MSKTFTRLIRKGCGVAKNQLELGSSLLFLLSKIFFYFLADSLKVQI